MRSCGSLLMETEALGCTYDDAALLAKYAGHVTGTNAFISFVQRAMAGESSQTPQ
jgi:hypothetical protein